jgi:hypothetical protein
MNKRQGLKVSIAEVSVMKRMGLGILGIALILGVMAGVAEAESKPERESPVAGQQQKTAPTIWAGKSGGFKIRWTDGDIQAHSLKSPNQVVFSARSLAKQDFARFKAAENKYGFKERFCEVVYSYKILSLTGSILSFLEETGVDCEKTAHPSLTNRFTVIDLEKSGDFSKKRVTLTDYFPKEVVYQALLADPQVQRALARREPPLPQSPRSLAELYDSLKDVFLSDGECSYELPEDFLTRFAFHHLEGDKVAVRLALPYFGEVCRGLYLDLDLLLPMPESLKERLALAASGKEGFLMQDQSRLAGGEDKYTIMRFTKGKKPPGW